MLVPGFTAWKDLNLLKQFPMMTALLSCLGDKKTQKQSLDSAISFRFGVHNLSWLPWGAFNQGFHQCINAKMLTRDTLSNARRIMGS